MKLTEFTKVEWFDVCRRCKPDLTWDEFEHMWDEFCAERARQSAH